jgi:hypothetical protein
MFLHSKLALRIVRGLDAGEMLHVESLFYDRKAIYDCFSQRGLDRF